MSEDRPIEDERTGSVEGPIRLQHKTSAQTQSFFAECRKQFAEQTGLSPDSVEQAFDAEFELDFQAGPRSLRKRWQEEAEVWNRIASNLGKAISEIETLSPSARFFYEHVIEGLPDRLAGVTATAEAAEGFADECGASRGNPQADVIAKAVARAFEIEGRSVTFGTEPQSKEPSTDFGRAVQTAIQIFKPEGNNGQVADWNAPARNACPNAMATRAF